MKERLISAFVALLIIIPLLVLGGIYFDILVIVLGLLGLKELLDLKKDIPNFVKYVSYVLFLILLIYGYTYTGKIFLMNYTFLIICLLILLSSLLVFRNKKYSIDDVFYLFASIIFLSSAFHLFTVVRAKSLMITIYLILITTMTDTFAFMIGRKYGKNKLMRDISPNKTIEGFVAGSIIGPIIACLFYYFLINKANVLIIILVTIFLSIVGQIGDLVFSSIKRHFKIKDFSNIMPGHGGILDRLDSIIFVLFAYIVISAIFVL